MPRSRTSRSFGSNLEAGRVLGESFKIMVKNAPQFGALTLLVFLPVIILYGMLIYGTVSGDEAILGPIAENVIAFTAVFFGLTLILSWTLSGMLVYGVYQHMLDRPVRIGDCIQAGLARVGPVVGTSILAGLATLLGTAACIIPGIIIGCAVWIAVPATVIEGLSPVKALNRSTALTKGARVSIFCVLFVVGLAQKLSELAVEAVFSGHDGTTVALNLSATLFLMLFFSLWGAVAPAVGYHDIRRSTEGIDVEELAAVFD